jgi:hypothetical protein
MLSAKDAANLAWRKTIEKLAREDRYTTKEKRKQTDEYRAGYNAAGQRIKIIEDLINSAANQGKYELRWREDSFRSGNVFLAGVEGLEAGVSDLLSSAGYGRQSEITDIGEGIRLVMKINWICPKSP